MNNELTFSLLKETNQYGIYYCVPEAQRRIKCGIGRSCMFVMHRDEIVFIPQNYRSQYHALVQCEDFIQSKVKNG